MRAQTGFDGVAQVRHALQAIEITGGAVRDPPHGDIENDVLAARPVRGSIEPLFSPPLDIRPFPASIFRRSTSS